jgi:hypothetical protein
MRVILWIKAGERRQCGELSVVFVPLYAPAKAKRVIDVKNAAELRAKTLEFWKANRGTCDVPSLYIEASRDRKIARYDAAKKEVYAELARQDEASRL